MMTAHPVKVHSPAHTAYHLRNGREMLAVVDTWPDSDEDMKQRACELARRWNAFESGGEVERLRAALENLLNFHEKKCHEGPYLEAARAALAAAKGGAA